MKTVHVAVVLLLATVLALGVGPARAMDKIGEADVDGHVWMRSDSQAKRAFLLGAGSAIVLEYYIRTKNNERPSRFVQGWVDVLEKKNWMDMERTLDAYYSSHPDKMDENVFRVVWKHMIEPNTNK